MNELKDDMPVGIRKVVFQPKDGIYIVVLLGVPQELLEADWNDQGKIGELVDKLPGLQEFLDRGVETAEQIKEREGLEQCALTGRFGVPMLMKGLATHKGGLEFLEERETGIVTAYLPDQNTFAVWFNKERWFTFQDWTEEKFNEYFDTFVVMEEEEDD